MVGFATRDFRRGVPQFGDKLARSPMVGIVDLVPPSSFFFQVSVSRRSREPGEYYLGKNGIASRQICIILLLFLLFLPFGAWLLRPTRRHVLFLQNIRGQRSYISDSGRAKRDLLVRLGSPLGFGGGILRDALQNSAGVCFCFALAF
jgi:hypothetical protein